MKTLIRKELRETLKLAVVGMFIFVLMVLQNCHGSRAVLADLASQPYDADKVQPLLASGFLTQIGFFFAIFGALLGWMQIFNERHRDLWAFLVHRPVARTEIFLSKSIAGILLYLLATGVPLICLWAWVWRPGHIAAPFEWQMAIPSASFCLAGIVCYFAGMLTGLRQARWYASRGLGIAAAVVVCLAVIMGSHLWEPLLALGLGMVVLALAAWGAFQSSGHYAGQPASGRLALIFSLTVGSAAVIVLVLGLVVSVFFDQDHTWSYYSIDRTGVIYKVTQGRGKPPEILDLQGKPLLDEKTHRMMQMTEFNTRLAPGALLNVNFETPEPGSFAEPSRYFFLWKFTEDTAWYFWTKYGRLVGYDRQSRRVIGSIGPDGFSPALAGGGSRFDAPLNHNIWSQVNLRHTATNLYAIDLGNRMAQTIFTTTTDDPIGGAVVAEVPIENGKGRHVLAATRNFVHLLTVEGSPVWKLPFQPSYPDYRTIRLSYLPGVKQISVWLEPSYGRSRAKAVHLPTHALWLSADGSITKTFELPNIQNSFGGGLDEHLAVALMPPAMLTLLPFLDEDGILPLHRNKLIDTLSLCFAAAVYLAVVFCLCRRFSFPVRATVGWLIFLLLTGFPGLLAFLCLHEWPARERCPKCNRLRVVTRETCEHCGAAFLPPKPVGIEILEPA